MPSSRPWMPFYTGDYLRDPEVMELSIEVQGAYLILLFHMWEGNGKIRFNCKSVAKMLRIRDKKASDLCQKIEHLLTIFEENGDIFATQKRLKSEIEKSQTISDKRRRAVGSRADRQETQPGTNVPTNEVQNVEVVSDLYPYSHSHSHSHKEIEALESSPTPHLEDLPLSEGEVTETEPPSEQTEQEPKTQRQRRKEFGFRVSFDQFADLWNRHMPEYGLTQIASITRDRERAFKDRVLEDPVERNDITWWGDVLQFATESDFLMGKSPPQKGRPPWKMDVDWLIGSGTEVIDGQRRARDGTMLARLLEGKHHDQQPGRWRRGEYERSVQGAIPDAGTG